MVVGAGEGSREGGPGGVSRTGRPGGGLAWWEWKAEEDVSMADSQGLWGWGEGCRGGSCFTILQQILS